MFENRVLRRAREPKRDEVTGGWKKLHNEELHNLYSSPSIIRIIESRKRIWTGHIARMGTKRRNTYWILAGKPKRRRPLGRLRRRWIVNVKMDLGEIRWGGMKWIDLDWDRDQWRALMNMVVSLRVL
jgi:hypothetical protein